jgi:4-hydroxy-tetrahydrodipicolinate reductase
MKIALIGYGKMGKEIEQIALGKGHEIALIIDKDNLEDLNKEKLQGIDVAIEFSSPDTAYDNIMTCIEAGTPVVVGTTGWLDKWDTVQQACDANKAALFWASNFSVGVNILFAVNSYLAEIMNTYNNYKVDLKEVHHIHKLDAPSGTAISLAEQIDEKIDRVNGWSLDKKENTIPILAEREGEVKGYHEVNYDSEIDTIHISHNAKTRKGFAEGAVMAAEYLKGKTGIHSMKELLNL